MIGGLLKSTSRLALLAAAGVIVSGVAPAKAADLGGDCCADLEERVANLEATTVRKGNRLVSLTLSGHINRGVLWYDDGSMTGFRVADSIQSTSRFRMQGSAKIAAGWSAGYYLEVELVSTGSFGTDQIDYRRALPAIDPSHLAQPNGHGNSPFSLGIRQSHWYMKNDTLGTLSVGRLNSATKDMAGIDLGNIAMIANSDQRIIGGEMFMRRQGAGGREGLCAAGLGCTNTLRWTNMSGGFGDNFRWDGVRYDSPTLMGFTLSASVGDDVRWDVALRYSGEWNGLRVAAGVGYVVDMDETQYTGEPFTVAAGAIAGGFALKTGRREQQDFKLNASVWHMPTGLFVSGAYWHKEFHGQGVDASVAAFGTGGAQRPDVNMWWIAGGLRKNWFGIGDTTVYGEYGRTTDPLNGTALNTVGVTSAGGINFAAITDSAMDLWGAGIVQNIDKAAMSLYLGYQHRSADIKGCTTAANCAANVTVKQGFEDYQNVYAGAIIRF